MQKRTVKSLVVTLLAGVMLALAMTSCGVTLKPGDKGLYDKKNDVSYSHASTVYEAKALVKEYGKLAVTKKESYRLYTIPGTDATKMLATEDFNILYASDVSMPTLLEMIPSCLHICSDTKTVHELARIDDAAEVYALAHAYEKNESIPYSGGSPIRVFKVRFESTYFTGFYYTLTYIEYAEDLMIDGVSYGKYFLRSAYDNRFVAVGDAIHNAFGDETETSDDAEVGVVEAAIH